MSTPPKADARHPAPGAPLEDVAASQAESGRASGPAEMPPALNGERLVVGDLNGYVAGSGPPLVLVHSINAVASAAEMRPIFEHCRQTRTVFAIDLPGFGLSDMADRRYDPRLMTDALHAWAVQVRHRCGAVPIDAVAVSLGCEFLARAAVEQPAHWGRLALVSPTGLQGTQQRRDPPGSTQHKPWLHALLSAEPWAQGLYRLLTRPAVIRYFLQRTWGSKDIDEALWAYDVRTALQPGARFAPLHFLAGSLFSKDIHDVYEALSQPVWMSHGVRGDFKDFRGKALVHDSGSWQTTTYPTGALPYFERRVEFMKDLDAFLSGRGAGQGATRPLPAGRMAAA